MINHPLVKKEWQFLKWMMLLYGCVFAFFAILLNQSMVERKTYHLVQQHQEGIFMSQVYELSTVMVPTLLIGLMVMVGVLFIHDRNSHIGKFINSLPYTRKQYYRIKYLMGIITFTVPLVVFGGVLYLIRASHLGWMSRVYLYSPYGELLKAQDSAGIVLVWLLFLWIIMLFIYSFLMMVQTLMGQNIVASVVGGIVLLVPLFLGYVIPGNLSLLGIRDRMYRGEIIKWTQLFLLGRPEQKLIGRVSTLDHYDFMTISSKGYWIYSYQHIPLYIAILVGGIIITALLGFYFIQHNDVEKNGEIALYPWVGKLLVVGVTACSLLLFPILIVLFTRIESPVLTLVAMVIGGISGYFISSTSIEMTRKHG